LEAERASYFYRHFADANDQPPFDLTETWFIKFMHVLGRGVSKENAREIFDRVSFIIFNYDRCVEYFLRHALQRLYGISEQEASDIVSELHIIHPYGAVDDAVAFGSTSADYVA
jgi:hypothetical protein